MLSIKQFCELTGMCRTTCYYLAKQGMPVIKVNRKVMIVEADAMAWMKENSKSYKKTK